MYSSYFCKQGSSRPPYKLNFFNFYNQQLDYNTYNLFVNHYFINIIIFWLYPFQKKQSVLNTLVLIAYYLIFYFIILPEYIPLQLKVLLKEQLRLQLLLMCYVTILQTYNHIHYLLLNVQQKHPYHFQS